MSTSHLPRTSRAAAVLSLVAAVVIALVWQRAGVVGQEPKKDVNPAPVRRAEELSEAFHNAAEVTMPSVVTIVSKTKAHPVARNRNGGGNRGDNPFKGTPFEDFFKGHDFGDMIPGPRGGPRSGMGSGVIIDRSGIVLTNNHVVEGADEVIVHLADGREFKGEDIKTDEQTDLAVVRIRGAGTLPAAKMGDSDKMRIGDWVIAIGNPFELEQTVSAGIISGLGRELGRSSASRPFRARFLQTDAAINPGNSGGPLVNLQGEVVGINTAIATNTGSFSGIGFAIPVNVAKWVTGQLIQKGNVQRAYLGVGIDKVTPELAKQFGAETAEGVLINQVHPNTPASEAGFKDGDIVVKFGGQKVTNPSELQQLVERVPLDSKQDVDVIRDGKHVTLHVTTKALPKDFGHRASPNRPEHGSTDSQSYSDEALGIEVAELTGDQAEELGVSSNAGVAITKVEADKPAHESGLREGMVILAVARKPVKNIADFKAAMNGASVKDGVMFQVAGQGGKRFVVVKE
jgi:serine protease Do